MKYASVLAFILLAGCSGDIDKKENIDPGPEPDGEVSFEPGIYSMGSFQELPAGGSLEIVSGFQGGWHVEPVVYVENVPYDDLNGTIFIELQTTDGTRLASAGEQEMEPTFFDEEGDGYVYLSFPVVFDEEPFEYEGQTVMLDMNGTLDGHSIEIEQEVTLVDTVDEFGGGFGIRR